MSYGAKAGHVASLEEARAKYSGSCYGTLKLVASSSVEQYPFKEWRGESWQLIREDEFIAKRNAQQQRSKPGRMNERARKIIDLREGGVTISGTKYKPPTFLWNEEIEMRDCLRGHFDSNVQSYGRRPTLHAVEELESSCISILPSLSGGYMLTQEVMNKIPDPGRTVALCMNKSLWRDRLVLEEGMTFEFGTDSKGAPFCTMSIECITGCDRNLDRYSGANTTNRPSLVPVKSTRKGLPSKKSVSFGNAVLIDTTDQVVNVGRNEDDDEDGINDMPSGNIWMEPNAVIAASPPRKASSKSEKPKLIMRLTMGSKEKLIDFSPLLPDLLPFANSQSPTASPLLSSYSKRRSTGSGSKNKTAYFTIGGDSNCNLVLPNCSIKVIATIAAFENVFTLVVPHNMAETFVRGKILTPIQEQYARESGVHLILNPEQSIGLYDGDTIVFRNDISHRHENGCCSGLEMTVQILDPTEGYRTRINKTMVESVGLKWDMDGVGSGPQSDGSDSRGSRKNGSLTGKHKSMAGSREIEELAVEVRAPVRTSRWDGSCEWKYGSVEAFSLTGFSSQDEVTIGSSPLMTLSIKDPRLGRCHANIMRRSQKTFVIEAAKSSGKRSLLSMVAASTPPGLGAASTPPHLLLVGEVFRVGASEFRVIGFSKYKTPKSAASGYGNFTLTSGFNKPSSSDRRSRRSADSVDGLANEYVNDDGFSSDDESGQADSTSRHADFDAPKDFEGLQEQAEMYMRNKTERRGSIALIRHRPNEDEEKMMSKSISTFVTEDNVEMHVSNNVDKTFGLARVSEYKEVLSAFGLDEETRAITYPGLKSFLIIQGIKGPLQRRLFLVNEHECTIGSSPSCSIVVANDPHISPIHCRIVFNPCERHWRLVDANSRSGTFFRTSGEDPPLLLQPGQRFLMGNSQIRILGKVNEYSRGSTSTKFGSSFGIRRQIKSVFLGRGSSAEPALSSSNDATQIQEVPTSNSGSSPPRRRSSSPNVELSQSHARKSITNLAAASPALESDNQAPTPKDTGRVADESSFAFANEDAKTKPKNKESGCGCTVM